MTSMRPVRYWLEDGEWTPAILFVESGMLAVNLDTDAGRKVVGKAAWFTPSYVEYWNWLVPEVATEGTEPGQWSHQTTEEKKP